MKPKKITKKLTFSKSTIADLNSKELNTIRGGATTVGVCISCRTCDPSCNTCAATCKATCDDMTCFHYGTFCQF